MSETNIENIIINELLTAYGDNPNKVRKVVEKKLIEYEAFGKGQMAYIMKMALYYFNQLEEKRLTGLELISHDLGLKGFDTRKLRDFIYQRANNEISYEDFMRCTANLVTDKMLEDAEKKLFIEGYKYSKEVLLKIGEGLKDEGYIKDENTFVLALMGIIPAEPIWNNKKAKSHLVYLIERIREDGKCPYAEIGRNFRIELEPNNKKKYGFKDIDDIIKGATQQIGDQA